jgi:Skp family chaperone for outer membrane proteins
MNKTSLFIIALLFLLSGVNFSQQSKEKFRIGTFDSRCIAIAYAKSDEFKKEIDSMKIEHKKAKEEGNTQLAEKFEQLGQTRQFIMHQQGFSKASINNIIVNFNGVFPRLAEKNNLQMIISKWEIVFADESFELVDITDQLVDYFNPNEETKKVLEQVKLMDPVPIEEISINPMD